MFFTAYAENQDNLEHRWSTVVMGDGIGGRPPWIFINNTDEVERGFIFRFCFSVAPLPGNFSADALGCTYAERFVLHANCLSLCA